MHRPSAVLIVMLAMLAGCSTESRLYGDLPVVAKVDTGMTKAEVEQIGGPPQTISDRTAVPGTCFDYKLTKGSHQQAYNVSFNGQGKVDHTSFISCAEWSRLQTKARNPSRHSGGGGY